MKNVYRVLGGPARHDIILAFTLRHEKRALLFTFQHVRYKNKVEVYVNSISAGPNLEEDLVIEGFGTEHLLEESFFVRVIYNARERKGKLELISNECLHCSCVLEPYCEDEYCNQCGNRIH